MSDANDTGRLTYLVLQRLEREYPKDADLAFRAQLAVRIVQARLATANGDDVVFSHNVHDVAPRLAPQPEAPAPTGYPDRDKAARAKYRADTARANQACAVDTLPRPAPDVYGLRVDPSRVLCGAAETPTQKK